MKKRKLKYRKYETGGLTPSKFGAITQGAGMVGGLMSTSKDAGMQDAGAFIGGAGAGASAGMMIGGPVGAGIGAAVGGGISLYTNYKNRKANEKAEAEFKKREEERKAELRLNTDRNFLSTYDQKGNNENAMYKMGGEVPSQGILDGSPSAGGQAIPLSSTAAKLEGNGHEDGGIKYPELGVEAEGEEVVTQEGNKEYIFSDSIRVPNSKLTFAKTVEKTEKLKGKLEGRTDQRSKDTIKHLDNKTEMLKHKQESAKKLIDIENSKKMKYGGYTKYVDGGEVSANPNQSLFSNPLGDSMTAGYRFRQNTQDPTEQDYRSAYMAEEFDPNSPVSKIFSKYDGKINSYEDLQKYAAQEGINPDEFSAALDKRYGAGTTGTKGYGEGDMRNLQGKNYEAYKRYEKDYRDRSGSFTPPKQEARPAVTTPTTTPPATTGSGPVERSMPATGYENTDKLLYKKAGADALGSIVPFIDNISSKRKNDALAARDLPEKGLLSPLTADEYDYDAQKIAAKNMTHNTGKSISQGLANSNSAAALRGAMMGENIGRLNNIQSAETNKNVELRNRLKVANKGIEEKNIDTKYNNSIRDFRKQNYTDQLRQENVANAVEDGMKLIGGFKKENVHDRQNAQDINFMDERKRKEFLKKSPGEANRLGYRRKKVNT